MKFLNVNITVKIIAVFAFVSSTYRAHIACESSWEFDTSCPADRQLEELKQNEIDLILREHNAFRNKVALGKQKGFRSGKRRIKFHFSVFSKKNKNFPATRMATMTWNEELAKLAELNVKQCKM